MIKQLPLAKTFCFVQFRSKTNYSKVSANNLKAMSNVRKPMTKAMNLFSAKKPSKSSLLASAGNVLAEDSDDSNNSFSEHKVNIRKNIDFQELQDSSNDSSFLCQHKSMRRSFENSDNIFKQWNEKHESNSENETNDASTSLRTSLLQHAEDDKLSCGIRQLKLRPEVPHKECNDTYDSSFIDDERNSTLSEQSNVSSDEKENDIFLEGDILTPPTMNIPKSERRVTAKSKFVDFRKCVTDKKQKHNILKEKSQTSKKSTENRSTRRRIVILSDSSDDNKENDNVANISIPTYSTPDMPIKNVANDSDSSSDAYEIEKIKASVKKNFASKDTENSLDRSAIAIDNEFIEDGKKYDDSFIDDSDSDHSSSSSNESSYDSDDFSSDDLHEEEAENSLICDVNGTDDTNDDEAISLNILPGDLKRRISANKLNTSETSISLDIIPDPDLDAVRNIQDQVLLPSTKTPKILPKKLATKHTKTFLCSLSMENWDDERQCHPDALKYIRQYSRYKHELAKR